MAQFMLEVCEAFYKPAGTEGWTWYKK